MFSFWRKSKFNWIRKTHRHPSKTVSSKRDKKKKIKRETHSEEIVFSSQLCHARPLVYLHLKILSLLNYHRKKIFRRRPWKLFFLFAGLSFSERWKTCSWKVFAKSMMRGRTYVDLIIWWFDDLMICCFNDLMI